MSQLQFIIYIKTNYIENSDIDNPLKSHFITAESKILDPNKYLSKRFKLIRNTFNNMDKMFQLYSDEDQKEFLSYHGDVVEFEFNSAAREAEENIALWSIELSERKNIHYRRVYSFQELCEDMGGFFGIVYLLGQILNELFSLKNPSIDYLTHYFRVSHDDEDNQDTARDFSTKVWLEQTKSLNLSKCQKFMNSSKIFLCFL